MSHETIRSIFDTVVNDWAKTNNILVSFQNINFKPSIDQLYLKLYTLPADTSSNDLEGKLRTYLGVYQISIICPSGIGTGDSSEVINNLIELFPMNQAFYKDSFKVQVITPVAEAKAIQSDTTYTIPLSFQYRADIFL